MKKALDPLVSYDLLADEFEQRLTEELQENAPEEETEEFVKNLVREYIDDQEVADTKINEILRRGKKDVFCVYNSVRKHKVEALARSYAIRDYNAIKQVDELLAANGLTVYEVTVEPIMKKMQEM